MKRADDPVNLEVIDDEHALTLSELKDLKQLAANYRSAKIGVVAAVAIGSSFIGLAKAWAYLSVHMKG